MAGQLETLFPVRYLPKQYMPNQRWNDLYKSFGYIFDILKEKIDKLPELIDIENVPIEYAGRLANRAGVTLYPTIEDDEKIRRQLREFTFWVKIRGTARAIRASIRADGFNVQVYNLWSQDYVTFFREDIDVYFYAYTDIGLYSDTGIISDINGSFYLTSHFDVEITPNGWFRRNDRLYLFDDRQFQMVKNRINLDVKPVVTFPHYSFALEVPMVDDGQLYIDGGLYSEYTASSPTPMSRYYPEYYLLKPVKNMVHAMVISNNWHFSSVENLKSRIDFFKIGIGGENYGVLIPPNNATVASAVAASTNTGNETATSSGVYTGTVDGYFQVEVTTGGSYGGTGVVTRKFINAETGGITTIGTVTPTSGVPFVLSDGVSCTLTDGGGGLLTIGDKWTINVTTVGMFQPVNQLGFGLSMFGIVEFGDLTVVLDQSDMWMEDDFLFVDCQLPSSFTRDNINEVGLFIDTGEPIAIATFPNINMVEQNIKRMIFKIKIENLEIFGFGIFPFGTTPFGI